MNDECGDKTLLHLVLRNGRDCRKCGFKYADAEEKWPRDYKEEAKKAWVTVQERYRLSEMRPRDRYPTIEMFS